MRRLFLAAVALVSIVSRAGAIDFGWQTIRGGGVEYIVQVEPELIDSFRREGFTSEVPAGLRDIRRIRIEVGSSKLPNQGDMTGPTIAQTAPAASVEKTVEKTDDRNPPPAGPETFGQDEPKPTGAPADASAGNSTAAPPLLDSSRPVPPLPFFQSGPVKNIAANQVGSADRTPRPTITVAKERAVDRQIVEAGMPTAPASASDAEGANNAARAGVSKPWTVLVMVLLGLFASLGANIYLAWIHQGVRAKYRMLAARVGGGVAAV